MNHLITVTLQEHRQAPAPASVALSAAHNVALSKHITMLSIPFQANPIHSSKYNAPYICMKRLCSNLLLQEKSVWSGSTAPQASGRMIIRTGSMCRGMMSLFIVMEPSN